MNRTEHLDWAKARALEYVDMGDRANAIASIMSDLRKHPETEKHSGLALTGTLLFSGMLSDDAAVRKHIEGFN